MTTKKPRCQQVLDSSRKTGASHSSSRKVKVKSNGNTVLSCLHSQWQSNWIVHVALTNTNLNFIYFIYFKSYTYVKIDFT